ncbi:hypothetical protein EIELFIGP_00481 [Stenotrophomonas maltophilia]|nr:hypothetical protein EIELFIGP_00481 [Stenotrophomonas maltophilia]QNG93872.1 hypothetical protein AEPCKKLL_00599 [Stenotrophomonas maltophilia]SQG09758.1 Uncharacterised protein [Stenotrophomonas maltophilia]
MLNPKPVLDAGRYPRRPSAPSEYGLDRVQSAQHETQIGTGFDSSKLHQSSVSLQALTHSSGSSGATDMNRTTTSTVHGHLRRSKPDPPEHRSRTRGRIHRYHLHQDFRAKRLRLASAAPSSRLARTPRPLQASLSLPSTNDPSTRRTRLFFRRSQHLPFPSSCAARRHPLITQTKKSPLHNESRLSFELHLYSLSIIYGFILHINCPTSTSLLRAR